MAISTTPIKTVLKMAFVVERLMLLWVISNASTYGHFDDMYQVCMRSFLIS